MNPILNLADAQTPADPASDHRRRSKISRLPKKVRDHLNQMLEDGVPYKDIKQQLGDHGAAITIDNISEWKTKGGYETWLAEQFWREEMRARVETFDAPLTDTDPAQLPLVGLQISMTQICEQLRTLGAGSRKEQLENNVDKYLRMLNTLARLSKSFLALQQYRDAAARNTVAEPKKPAPKRDLDPEEERQLWLDRADDLFNFKSAARLRREIQQSALLKSEISNPQSNPGSAPLKSEISNPKSVCTSAPLHLSPEPPRNTVEAEPENATPAAPLKSEISNLKSCSSSVPVAHSPAQIINHNSEIINSPELCFECKAPLPPLRPDGQRPAPACPACNTRLFPPGTVWDHCQFCSTVNPILANNERPSSFCRHCGAVLPPPGQRFVTACPVCAATVPITNLGTHLSPYCPECHATLPLLAPAAQHASSCSCSCS